MTDKQIIIDGCDVSWCEHYTGNIGYLTDKNWTCRAKIQGTKCEDWSDCYFKRWQRKEQECEELKNRVAELSLFQLYKIQRDEAEQTLAEIKEIIHFNKTNRLSGGACISIEQILQKISEVEDE